MSEVEARTREALHEVVDGLGVTDHDVTRMEDELLSALERPHRLGLAGAREPRRRRWGLAAAGVAAAAAVAAGLALSADDRTDVRPAGPPASQFSSDVPLVPADLVGTWQNVPDSPWVWEFTADGRIGVVDTAGAYLEGAFTDRILFRRGDLYEMRTKDGCDETLRIRVVRPGAVALSGQRSSCSPGQGPDSEELLLERLSPEPYLEGDLYELWPPDNPAHANRKYFLQGVWLHVETHTVLVVGNPWEGSVTRYAFDDDGDGATDPDQRGRVTLSENAPPVFRPDAGQGGACRLAFASVVVDRHRMTTTSPGDACFPGVQTWVRI